MKTYRFTVPLIFLILVLLSCTRDDICDPNITATPLLIITFKDNANITQSKNATGLTVRKNNADATLVFRSTEPTDSIAIPLDTETDITELIFTLNDDDDDATETNSDILTFFYQRQEEYVNRTCGFKTTYSGLNVVDEDGVEEWITSLQILQTEITDEIEAHLILRF